MITDADQKAIKDAFIQKSKENHPDTNPDDPEGAAHRFQSVVAAYEVLSDADQKRSVDESLRGGGGPSQEAEAEGEAGRGDLGLGAPAGRGRRWRRRLQSYVANELI